MEKVASNMEATFSVDLCVLLLFRQRLEFLLIVATNIEMQGR